LRELTETFRSLGIVHFGVSRAQQVKSGKAGRGGLAWVFNLVLISLSRMRRNCCSYQSATRRLRKNSQGMWHDQRSVGAFVSDWLMCDIQSIFDYCE